MCLHTIPSGIFRDNVSQCNWQWSCNRSTVILKNEIAQLRETKCQCKRQAY